MKKILLVALLTTLSFVGYANEADEEEAVLLERIEWCQSEGQKLFQKAMEMNTTSTSQQETTKALYMGGGSKKKIREDENNALIFQSTLDGAMRCFELERGYRSDLELHRLYQEICCDCDYSDDEAIINFPTSKLQTLKSVLSTRK
ncbi:MAG: hypothetical protein KR126chlam2_00608 [Chlamydiae bacterium]|nr:hypothetical protein [Chlamydiota bacterium]